MTDLAQTLFKNKKVKLRTLLPFGFLESNNTYTYSRGLLGGQFEMLVTVTTEGKVSTAVIDALSGEGYELHRISRATGAFVGAVREEYAAVLAEIVQACFEPNVFKSEDAQQVVRYVREKYQDELQFLWRRFPENAILRRKDNQKWYAALLVLQRKKLGLDQAGLVEIIDLRGKPEHIAALVDGKRYFPGYHMNKKHWFTMCLDGSVPLQEMFDWIDQSFVLAVR